MSATGRSAAAGTGVVRHPDDFYATPEWCTRAILPHLPRLGRVIDPCCGDGAILRVVKDSWPESTPVGIEIDVTRAGVAASRGVDVWQTDALAVDSWLVAAPALVLTNPPFGLALEFVQRALRETKGVGAVAMLLRLNWLASQKRAEWMRIHTPSVYVLPKRPSFTGKGTDATEYAWMVWRNGAPTVHILDVSSRMPALF